MIRLACLLLGLCGLAAWHPAHATVLRLEDILSMYTAPDALFRPSSWQSRMVSSHDHTGGNRDGEGVIRREGDRFVIAELDGPGVITRIWSANPTGILRIQIDDRSAPVVEMPFREFFEGASEPFGGALVSTTDGNSIGPHISLVPIPYQSFCKITLTEPCFYQIDYSRPKDAVSVESLTLPIRGEPESALEELAESYAVPERKRDLNVSDGERVAWSGSIAAGDQIRVATVSGPGVVRSFRMRWPEPREPVGRDLLVSVFWDGEEHASVLCPVTDFFGGPVRTKDIGRLEDGWAYVRLPMPFRQQAVITLENGSETEAYRVEFECIIEPVDTLPFDTRYFHAAWHRTIETEVVAVEWPAALEDPPTVVPDMVYPLRLFVPGHVVAISTMVSPNPHSDTMIFLDQAGWPPAIPGTGQYGLFHMHSEGKPVTSSIAASRKTEGGLVAAMRLFTPFPLDFTQRFELGFEHGHANLLRQDQSTVVYWYQDEPHQPLAWPLPRSARRFRSAAPIQSVWYREGGWLRPEPLLEAEHLSVLASRGIYETRDMTIFGTDWSGNQTLEFEAPGPGASIRFDVPPVTYSGLYQVNAVVTRSPESGYLSMQVDGEELVQAIDLYHSNTTPGLVESQEPLFLHATDDVSIEFAVIGKNPKASGYKIGVDRVGFQPLEWNPAEVQREGPFAEEAGDEFRWSSWSGSSSLGSGFAGEETESEVIEPKSGAFPLPDESDAGSLYRITFAVNPPQAGIYRVEIQPAGTIPFLLEREGAGVNRLQPRLTVNGIPLRNDGVERLDPVTLASEPLRFSVPMDEGENIISFLLDRQAIDAFTPMVFGVN